MGGRGWVIFGLAVREEEMAVVLRIDGGHVREGGKGERASKRTPVGSLFTPNFLPPNTCLALRLSHIFLREDIFSIMNSS